MTAYQIKVVQAVVGLIYQQNSFDLDILQKFTGKKIGDKFSKLKTNRPDIQYGDLVEDWTMDIITNMSGKEAFFSNWKEENPNPQKINKESLLKKFTNKIEKQVQKLYERFLKDLIDGYGLNYQKLEQLPEEESDDWED